MKQKGLFFFLRLLCVFVLSTAFAAAQDFPPLRREPARAERDSVVQSRRSSYVPEWYSMFTNIPNNWARFARSTFTADKIPAFVGMGVLTGGLIAVDDETYLMSDRLYRSNNFAKDASDFF